MSNGTIYKRREGVFGIAVLLAGLSITSLCLMPIVLSDTVPHPLLPTVQQEFMFFDVFGLVCGCWLLSWVSALNGWSVAARTGQWGGIVLLCAEEAMLLGVWKSLLERGIMTVGDWAAPMVVQTYLLGFLFGFFTLPSLTANGNRTLTGLGTLLLLLPWLVGRDPLISGVQYLHGLMF